LFNSFGKRRGRVKLRGGEGKAENGKDLSGTWLVSRPSCKISRCSVTATAISVAGHKKKLQILQTKYPPYYAWRIKTTASRPFVWDNPGEVVPELSQRLTQYFTVTTSLFSCSYDGLK